MRFNHLEDKIDKRFAKYDTDIAELKDKVDFFVQTQTPPLQGVFYEGQLWDACSLLQCCHCASVASSQFQFPMKDVA
jgi:hypothetical protein